MLISVSDPKKLRLSLWIGASFVFFRLLLDITYYFIIGDVWQFLGFEQKFDLARELISLALLMFLGMLVRSRYPKPSDYFLTVLILGIIVPTGTLFAFNGGSGEFFLALNLCMLIIWATCRVPPLRLQVLRNSERLWVLVSFLGLFALHAVLYQRGGWSHFNLDFTQIYVFRDIVHEHILKGSVAYLFSWGAKIFSVFLILYMIHKSHYFMAFALILGQLLLFGLTTHKAILFYPLLAVIVMTLYYYRVSPAVMVWGITIVILAASAIYLSTDWHRPVSWFVLRVFMVTSLLHYNYHEFFTLNEFTYFSNSFLSAVIPYPYDDLVPNIIGKDLWAAGTESFANTGFLANGYMHMGYFGMLLYSILVGLAFWVADSVIRRMRAPWIGVALFMIPVWQLRSADLPSVMITHGMLLVLIGLWALGRTRTKSHAAVTAVPQTFC